MLKGYRNTLWLNWFIYINSTNQNPARFWQQFVVNHQIVTEIKKLLLYVIIELSAPTILYRGTFNIVSNVDQHKSCEIFTAFKQVFLHVFSPHICMRRNVSAILFSQRPCIVVTFDFSTINSEIQWVQIAKRKQIIVILFCWNFKR